MHSEPTIVLVSTKDQDRWPVPTPEVLDSRTCRQFPLAMNTKRIFTACSKIRFRPEVSILGADQEDRGLLGPEWFVWPG